MTIPLRIICNTDIPNLPDIELVKLEDLDRFRTGDHLLWIDNFDDHALADLTDQKGYPESIISDTYLCYESDLPIPIYTVALRELHHRLDLVPCPDPQDTRSTVSFFYNKKAIHRALTAKMIETFGLDASYIYSGIGREIDLSPMLEHMRQAGLDAQQWASMLSPISMPRRWFDGDDRQIRPDRDDPDCVSLVHGGDAVWSWHAGGGDAVKHSAISLITDNTEYQHAFPYSWKTGYALIGLTFPIWVGAWNGPSQMRQIGFDVFDDIIDHGYESLPNLFDRSWQAVTRNLDLLQDFDRCRELRWQLRDRLLENRRRLLSGALQQHALAQMAAWPAGLQQTTGRILQKLYLAQVLPQTDK